MVVIKPNVLCGGIALKLRNFLLYFVYFVIFFCYTVHIFLLIFLLLLVRSFLYLVLLSSAFLYFFFQVYIAKVDPTSSLGLSTDSIYSYSMGHIKRVLGGEAPETQPSRCMSRGPSSITVALKGLQKMYNF